jgi:hypothetical protein
MMSALVAPTTNSIARPSSSTWRSYDYMRLMAR